MSPRGDSQIAVARRLGVAADLPSPRGGGIGNLPRAQRHRAFSLSLEELSTPHK